MIILLFITVTLAQISFKVKTPPPPPEMESIGTEPEPPSDYDNLFSYKGYFDPYPDDVQAFMIHGHRRKRHRVSCGKDRKGRHCDFARSHHQHSFYNKDCIHYAGTIEIYGVWQCGSRKNLRDGAIIRLGVEMHELMLKYKQDKNTYALERFERILEYNRGIYAEMKEIFNVNARKNMEKVVQALELTNAQIFKNFLSMHDISKEIILEIKQGRQVELDEIKGQLSELLEEFPPPTSICQNLNACDVCLFRQGCVWCFEEMSCHEGSLKDGAYYHTCDVWVQNNECPEIDEDEEGQGHASKTQVKEELGDYANQADLDLTQKIYLASKQRDMVQLKNQIENRQAVLRQMNNLVVNLRARNVQMIEQFVKHELYDKQFLENHVDEEEAEEGKDKFMEEIDELLEDEAEYDAEIKERQQRKKDKQKKLEEKQEKLFKEQHKEMVIDKKKYKMKEPLNNVLKDQGQDEEEEEF